MKIKLAQIILGLGILVAMTLSIALDSNGFYIRESLGEPGNWKVIFNPDTREVVATILSYIVLLLGLAIMGVALALLIAKIRSGYVAPTFEMKISEKRLVIAYAGLALIAAVSVFFVIIWGFPTSYNYLTSDGLMRDVMFSPGHRFMWAHGLSMLTFLFTIIALAFNIVEFWPVRLLKVKVKE